ncbi:cullin-9-like isoform X2 [Mixophyes fleayi]|uniref:cullin-9-like isoform X2 n=1 Tax=Mixophyes fleayi TaxID=3061075 RepID=UPI003F4D7B98
MLVGERRNGNLVVQLSPELQAQPVQLLRQRWNTDGYIEYLIRWAVENREKGGGNSGIGSRTESKSSTILMWMSAEEVYTSCPTLLGNQKPKEPGHFEEKTSGGPAEGPLQEMTEDVRMLVQRATRQMSQSSAPNSSILNTIHVLSAYANIDSLAGVFKETGALDLLMKMLCNPEKQICKNAGKMLRALASHDAGSRAHVLLSLSQQDGIAQHMDFESRYTLLQLFAETTSSEEHCISFDGIHLPQIPGKQLFSLVKRYLCVTSLLDQLSSDQPDRNNEIRLQHLFDFSMAMGSLICELVRVMGWVNEQTSDVDVCRDYDQPRVLRSIFQPKVPSCSTFHTAVTAPLRATATKKKSVKEFMSPSDFESHNDYVDYIQGALKPGMSVRMLEDYDEISAGDEGVFRQSNNGMPPVQVHWQRLGCTYWVQWDMLEIVNSNVEMRERKNITALTAEPVTPALHWTTSRRTDPIRSLKTVTELIRQDEWWEILFFIRQLDHEGHQKVMEVIREKLELLGQDMDTLRQVSVSVDAAQDIVRFLSDHCQGFLLSDLQRSHIYNKFFLHIVSGKRHNARSYSSVFKTSKWQSVVSECSETMGNADQSNDLQMLKTLLRLEGLQLPDAADEKRTRENSDPEAEIKSSLESCRAMVHHVCHDRRSTGLNVTQEHPEHSESKCVPGKSSLSENTVKMLVELLTSEMKEKLLVVTCLQLTYVVMSKYDWRVLFATEGGVRAVLGCMQEHQSSAAVQHIGLAVLKVLTGTGCCDLRGSSRRYTLNPSDVQVIKEIFSSIGSAASASSISLLRAIACAIGKMLSTPGCFTSVLNGLLVVRMLTDNHQGLSEQLSRCELPSVLQSVSEDSSNSMSALQRHILSLLIHNCMSELSTGTSHIYSAESAQVLTLQEMDLPALLSSLKDGQMCQELLPSLERCVCDDVSSLRCNVSQLLTDPDFFLQLLSSLEQLRSEKHLQLCVYRIMNKALHLYQEDTVPWHKSIRPSLNSLGAYSSEKEVVQVVIGFLYNLASTSKDCAVVMCCLDTKDALNKVMEKHSSDLQQAADLKDLLTSCEKYAGLHQKMATTVLAGCIQMVLGQIEEHRRSQLQINIPFLDVFLRNLHQGSETEHKEVKCWEKLEVSSNPYCAYKLTDGNPKSYWQSRGNSGSHFITIYLLQGVEIRQLVLIVASEDSSYMPSQVEVMGGENVSCINMELNTVNISSSAGRVVLLENVTRFWPIIQVKIKRCQQGGIDTRVRGLEVLGPKPTFWPVFKEQLCRRTFLFYTSRAHSWGQEICDKKEHLLQLFGRLNRALSHEQEFAERFLPDDEAAQALGRMCWEALITPLVQSITTSDSEGVSSLSWLLTRYLENIQLSRRPKSRTSVFNSRVRRLTHLLVHVDNSPPDTVELKPPSKINGKSRDSSSVCVKVTSPGLSSMAGIAQCWQGVVQKQVQRFLEVSWNDVDLVPRFCSLYLSLRRAMEEMFGQQTRFLLSLRQGFCEGLLQLSFLTAIHIYSLWSISSNSWSLSCACLS